MRVALAVAINASAVIGASVRAGRTPSVLTPAPERHLQEEDLEDYGTFDESELYNDAAIARDLHKKKGVYEAHYVEPVPLPPAQHVVVPIVVAAPQEMRQEVSCPAGYDIRGNRCVANELVAPDMTCPPGTQLLDGQCAQFARGKRECPDGYRVSGNRCIATEIVPAEFTCADGGELDETGTSCKLFHATGAQCPKGFRLDAHEMCIQQFPAQVACPAGHHMQKHGCVKEIGTEASPMCPVGSELDPDGKKCFTMSPGKSKCPKGFKMSKDTGRCVKKAKKVLASCPEGFTEYSGHKAICERMLTVPPQLTCPPGSALDPLTGQCQSEMMAAAVCPDGFTNSRSQPHLCERVVDEIGRCPHGTVAIGFGADLRCQATIEHEITECCPPGFEMMHGRCERHEVFAAVAKCQGDCSRVRAVAPVLRCPHEFVLDGRRCVRHFGHPCPEAAAMDACAGYVQYTASLRGDDTAQQLPASCMRVVAEVCHSEEAQPADLVCPEGDFDGTHCIVRENIASLEQVCRFGELDPVTGQCIKVSTVPVKTECPVGTTRIGRRCVEYEEHAPEFMCPEGAISDRTGSCIMRAATISGGLAEVLRTPPIPVCAAGTLQGSTCYDVERVPRQFVCPQGAIPAGKHKADAATVIENSADIGKYCLLITDMVVPPPHKKHVKPKYYCPDGQLAKGKHCHSHAKAEPLVSCPQGSVMEGQLCTRRLPAVVGGNRVTSTAAVPICPPGTSVQGTKCVATREIASDLKCPPGYIAQPSRNVEKECARFSEMVTVCPGGTMQTADGCLRERSTAPVVQNIPVAKCAEPACM